MNICFQYKRTDKEGYKYIFHEADSIYNGQRLVDVNEVDYPIASLEPIAVWTAKCIIKITKP